MTQSKNFYVIVDRIGTSAVSRWSSAACDSAGKSASITIGKAIEIAAPLVHERELEADVEAKV